MPKFKESISPLNRARQFMPFAALRGYLDLVREKERIPYERRVLTEEELAALSRKLQQISRGDIIRVTYYDNDAYITIEGMVGVIDTFSRRLTVVKTAISFDDILTFEGGGISEENSF